MPLAKSKLDSPALTELANPDPCGVLLCSALLCSAAQKSRRPTVCALPSFRCAPQTLGASNLLPTH